MPGMHSSLSMGCHLHSPRTLAVIGLALVGLAFLASVQTARTDSEIFTQFPDNVEATGGVERWGFPTSAIFEEGPGTLTQYYQRGVVDWRPPPQGGSHVFQRRLAWDYLGGGFGGSSDQGVELELTNPNPGDVSGPWGHKLSNISVEGVDVGFKDFFDRLGGVAAFGFPKTDARSDTNAGAVLHDSTRPMDSRFRQYFQAAVMEFHPESTSAPVKLRLLGDTLRDLLHPNGSWAALAPFHDESSLESGQAFDVMQAQPPPDAPPTAQPVPPIEVPQANEPVKLFSSDHVTYESGAASITLSRSAELEVTVQKIGDIAVRIVFNDVDDASLLNLETLLLGPHQIQGTLSRFAWVRVRGDTTAIVKNEQAIGLPDDETAYGLRFVFDGGSVGLFINGAPVHLEASLPYDDIFLIVGCTPLGSAASIEFSAMSIIGLPLASVGFRRRVTLTRSPGEVSAVASTYGHGYAPPRPTHSQCRRTSVW